MNCEQFETLLADALGDELSPADCGALEEHAVQCAVCRGEYESTRRALSEFRSLPAAQRVLLGDIGSELIPSADFRFGKTSFAGRRRTSLRGSAGRSFAGILRYAASLLIAFTAGYAVHVGVTLSNGPRTRVVPPVEVAVDGSPRSQSLQTAFARVHLQQPTRSALAKAMIAMVPRR